MAKKCVACEKAKMKKMEAGGATEKLAANYGDPKKVTRGDIIVAAKKNAGKMKKGGAVKKK
jgi:hypothetical protein